MITVEQAKELMIQRIGLLPIKEVPLHKAHGHFAASGIISPHDHPLFDNSAVDGYAFAFTGPGVELKVIGSVPAGGTLPRSFKPGECARIFTGAMMPDGADTVVMQEHVQRREDVIIHADERLTKGGNVRLKGEQVKAGDLVVLNGDCLGPAVIGLLASVGIARVKVHEWPAVAIVITGSEFIEKGASPVEGKIFNSNDLMLQAALAQAGITPSILHAKDEPEALETILRQAMSHHDVVICTGGVSVGEHDLVKDAFMNDGGEIIFHRVSQKPGNPMLLGQAGRTLFFGLPGNPRAVMILFWEYVLPAIRAMMGASMPWPRSKMLPLTAVVRSNGKRSEFRAARATNAGVELLRDEGSHMLASLATADALVYIPTGVGELNAGDLVEVHHIPGT